MTFDAPPARLTHLRRRRAAMAAGSATLLVGAMAFAPLGFARPWLGQPPPLRAALASSEGASSFPSSMSSVTSSFGSMSADGAQGRLPGAGPFTGMFGDLPGGRSVAPDGGPGDGTGDTDSGPGGAARLTTGTAEDAATQATSEQERGVVLVDTVLDGQAGEAAGTGIVLTSDGLVLTNNHVIEESSAITVTVPETGDSYPASVVAADPTADVAVLRLEGASGLTEAPLDDEDPVVGEDVTAVGNAEGGGELVAVSGPVTSVSATVTTTSELTGRTTSLPDMIAFAAAVVSGDSGGVLLDDDGQVVGMTTAASFGPGGSSGYAIDIDAALAAVAALTGDTVQPA